MTVEIDIIDRIYYNIQEFCEVNSLDMIEYMTDAITEKYNLDKYGDLNEKLVKKEEKKPPTRRIKKNEITVDTKVIETVNTVKIEEPINKETSENKEPQPPVEVQAEEKPKKTRRTLKTK